MMVTMTETPQQRYEREREGKEGRMERHVSLWHKKQRIEAYLPTLYRQRDEAADRLAQVEQLRADE